MPEDVVPIPIILDFIVKLLFVKLSNVNLIKLLEISDLKDPIESFENPDSELVVSK